MEDVRKELEQFSRVSWLLVHVFAFENKAAFPLVHTELWIKSELFYSSSKHKTLLYFTSHSEKMAILGLTLYE